ncbi:Uncharacterized protein M6B38_214050 [Iris pallida]|uniref:ATPase inhibitor n=1 Tax=Iris pallida TaxID=29817 RepID=A0AAX6E2B0_IRIPA|nr:Uncharacterized protein M6B38_214050 [Iris pallida]
MATRSVIPRSGLYYQSVIRMDQGRGAYRYFSEDKGRIFREEERAKEAVYIQKMERERMEKLRKKMEKEKAEADKAAAAGKKQPEET